jgi:hypothetical protein
MSLQQLFDQLPPTHIGHFTENYLETVKTTLEIAKPKNIIEFGFNAGHSAILWLTMSEANLVSVDPGEGAPYLGMNKVKELFPTRFMGFACSSQSKWVANYLTNIEIDLLSVDGDHSYTGCLNDLYLGKSLKAKYMLVDNYEDPHGVGKAVQTFLNLNLDYTIEFEKQIPNTDISVVLLKAING